MVVNTGQKYSALWEAFVSHFDVVIVGGGPAGLATATYARQRGLAPLLLEAETFGGQLINLYPTKPVDNFPAQPELASGDLARRLADQAAHFGAELREREPVEFVGRADGCFVVRTDKEEIEAEAIVLSLGLGRFTPRTLGLESEQSYLGRGLTYRLPPREQIKAERVVVVGGGDSAVDTALSLEQIAQVTLVHHGDGLRAFGHPRSGSPSRACRCCWPPRSSASAARTASSTSSCRSRTRRASRCPPTL